MPAPLTSDDKAFIRAILDDPYELTTWLIYADWMDEQDDPRAEFLRLSVERKQLEEGDPGIGALEQRLAALRGALDPNWVLVFDTARLANCRGNGWRFVCPLTWNQLTPTDLHDIRICHTCRSPVFFCHTIEEAQLFTTSGQCVAVSSRIPLEQIPEQEVEHVTVGLLLDPDDFADFEREESEGNGAHQALPDSPPIRSERRHWWKFW
jgi:uncharacterized protein (TIGR02996 family)